MKTPLSVYALYHSDNPEGVQIYSKLYSLLCRDVSNPFSDGLDIPVYYSTGNEGHICEVRLSDTLKKVILVFIDINMFCSTKWAEYVKRLTDNADEDTLIVGVKQYKHAFSFNKKLGETQSIVFSTSTAKDTILLFEDDNWDVFTTQLFDLLIRFVSERGYKEHLSVFISHSKRDNDNKGERMAMDVRSFLYSDTKLNSFFDVHDILDGYRFEEQIKNQAGQNALLILFTDTYSSREWCRIEALTAKTNKVPIVAVFMLEGKVDRIFPYIGNIPSTIFDGNWRKVINLLLRTSLDHTIESEMLKNACDVNTEYLPYPPESFNMSLLKEETNKLIYPEPPLGNEELSILVNICSRMGRKVSFLTPMNHLTESLNLQERPIAISISESGNLQSLGIGEEMFRDLMIEITRHILKANGKLVYGGDLRKDGYTEIFKELSDQYGQKEKVAEDVVYISNYLSWPIFNNITLAQKADYMKSRVKLVYAIPGDNVSRDEKSLFIPPSTLENRLKWASSLTTMRNQMADNSFARVLVGGKTNGFSGYMAGIAEEFKIAIERKQPVFLIGGFGGAASLLSEILQGKQTSKVLLEQASEMPLYRELYEWCNNNDFRIAYEFFDHISISNLNNGLEEGDNIRLLDSVDIIEIVSLIIKGLNNIIQ